MLRLSPLRTLQKRSHLSQYRNSSKTTSLPHFLESVQPRSVERNVIKQTIRKFVQVEIVPNIASWEEQCAIPREVFKKAGDVGILGIAMPQIYGGTGGGMVDLIDMIDELGSAGSSGILAALTAHQIALPSLIEKASSTMKDSILPKIISGDIISALSISEPQGGLDHMSKLAVTSSLEEVGVELNTDGSFSPKKSYVLKGEKAFVTNGMIADLIFVAARGKIEGEQSQSGSSMFVVRRNAQGLTATKWSKMGSHCSDTASLSFDYVQLSPEDLVGEEGRGLQGIMKNFNKMRLMQAATCEALARQCYEEALDWARLKRLSDKALVEQQAIRHKLVEMLTRCNSVRALLISVAQAWDDGHDPVPEICQLKIFASLNLEKNASDAISILGGLGLVTGTKSERIFRECKALQIGGGRTESMRDMAAHQLSY